MLDVVNKLLNTMVCWQCLCFAFTTQANFTANNLNFHWRWRWWDWIQAIFLILFYFNIVASIQRIFLISLLFLNSKKYENIYAPSERISTHFGQSVLLLETTKSWIVELHWHTWVWRGSITYVWDSCQIQITKSC